MTRRICLLSFAAALRLPAHVNFCVVGAITKVEPDKLGVNTKGKTVGIEMNADTKVTRNGKQVPRTELKPGLSVVVEACGDKIEELLAVEIKLVPPLPVLPAKPAKPAK